MNRLLIFLISITTIAGCSKKAASPKADKLFGLASPVQLGYGLNTILLADYFPTDLVVDSVQIDGPLGVGVELKGFQVLISCDEQGLSPLYNLIVFAEGIPYSILLKTPKGQKVSFEYLDSTAKSVYVKGSFNDWDTSMCRLSKKGDSWIGNAVIDAGSYQYKLVVDGKEINDPGNNETVSNGMGGTNSLLKVSAPREGTIPKLSTHSFDGKDVVIAASNILKVYAYWNNYRIEAEPNEQGYLIKIPPFAKYDKRSHLRVFGCSEFTESNDLLIPLEKGKVITETSKLNNNDWQSSIMYFLMVDRFMDGKKENNHPVDNPEILPKANFYGGDFVGITKKIKDGYFRKLGVNTIWISPITRNPDDAWGQYHNPETKFSGYHGYWPVSSTEVDPRFGNSEELRDLLATAHAHGISMLLDYVANHVHQQHSVYKNHPDWFTPLYLPDGAMNIEKWDEHRLTTWFDTFLPTLDLNNPKVAEFMVDSASFWITEYDFDGFRYDATKQIPEKFWRLLTKRVKETSKKKGKYLYQIGETYGSHKLINSYIGSGMLDGQFDFNLYDNALPVFADENEPYSRLSDALQKSMKTYGSHHLMGNISGNQDKPRFISFADGSLSFDAEWLEYKRIGWKQTIGIKDSIGYKKLTLFHAFNMTIPGIPIVYYGDEIGMPGAGDPDNRRMMRFDLANNPEKELKETVSDLASKRMQHMALMYGDFTLLSDSVVLAYQRKYFDDEVLVVINRSTRNVNYQLPSGKTIQVKPYSYQIITD